MKTLLTLFAVFSFSACYSQIIATVQLKEPIEGICDSTKIHAMLGYFGAGEKAEPSVSKNGIQARINARCAYLKENPKTKGKGSITITVNCEGEMVDWKMDGKKIKPELEAQIHEVFKNIDSWKPGKYGDEPVDSQEFFFFEIKKGVFTFD